MKVKRSPPVYNLYDDEMYFAMSGIGLDRYKADNLPLFYEQD